MDIVNTRPGDIFDYDVARDGRDTNIIKDLTGTSSASGGELTINATDIVTYKGFRNLSVEFYLKVPVVPVAGQAKIWGYKNASEAFGAAYFQITGAVFQIVVNNPDGTALYTRVIPWNSAWTAVKTKYRISLTEHTCIFAINDTIVAILDNDTTDSSNNNIIFGKLSFAPMSARVTNTNSDDLKLSYIKTY